MAPPPPDAAPDAATPFHDLRAYLAIPRVTGLALSPDGTWLAAVVQQPAPDGRKFVPSIWRIPTGQDASAPGPARLTWSGQGEESPAFLPDGSLVFASARQDGAAAPAEDTADNSARPGLWLLPPAGEAHRIADLPGGVAGLAAASGAPEVLVISPLLAGSADLEQDAQRRKQRREAGVTAILHERGPVRLWDRDLGPDQPRMLVARVDSGALAGPLRDLTPDPGRALDEQHTELAPDGSLAVTGWSVWEGPAGPREEVAVIGTEGGARRVLLAAPGHDFSMPRVSPDGRWVVCRRASHDTADAPGDVTLVLASLDAGKGQVTDLLAGLDRWPGETAWAADSRSVYFTADDYGRRPVFRVNLDGEVTRVTVDDAAYESLCPSPDGRWLYALRSAMESPPTPVRIALAPPAPATGHPGPPDGTAAVETEHAAVTPLPGPCGPVPVPGTVTDMTAAADDGTPIRGWLVLPGAASAERPAPLLLWVHGGPKSSWNSWSWRWNPWLMAARGYAVLMPDPALSTGYGLGFVARGHGRWGPRPYADLMSITDAVTARPDIDATRTAVMGASYGGYMANWIAGQTSRFCAIVSHAGLWALDQMFGTTDGPWHWRRHFGDPLRQPERYRENSPHLGGARIRTPMLVTHGDKDYRVPIGEALRLWSDLTGPDGTGTAARFLYFPTENHWVLSPGHFLVWYETIFAFLAEHVLGEEWRRPCLL